MQYAYTVKIQSDTHTYTQCASNILLTKTTAGRNEGALSYLRVRGLCKCFPAVVFVATIVVNRGIIFIS